MTENYTDDMIFRAVALELFSGLQIDSSLQRCLNPLSEVFPVDHLILQIYEAGLGAVRIISIVGETGPEQSLGDGLIPMDEKTRNLVVHNLARFREGSAAIGDPKLNPVAKRMLSLMDIPDRSVITLFLKTEKGRIGTLVLTARGENQYGEQHVHKLSVLYRPFSIALSNFLEQEELQMLRDRLSDDNQYLNRELLRISGDRIIGEDQGLKFVMEKVAKVSTGDSPVLITGETGVGKDVIAKAIHRRSRRCDGPFISVNCGAIPESLLDSELFGHEKGAFTGAHTDKRGRFERASGGTLFLDEIGEMPLSAQVRLLRVLQEKVLERVGGSDVIEADVRIIAATNRDLPDMIEKEQFRKDLWYRINVFPIEVPPLRRRKQDIPALVDYFIGEKTKELKLPRKPLIAPGALECLSSYEWPGNVRELANVVERAIILASEGMLHFSLEQKGMGQDSEIDKTYGKENFPSLDRMAEMHIRKALELCAGKVHGPDGAGELLGINPNTLRHRMKKLQIDFGRQ